MKNIIRVVGRGETGGRSIILYDAGDDYDDDDGNNLPESLPTAMRPEVPQQEILW